MRSFLVVAVVASASISGAAQAAEMSSGSGVVIGIHGEVLTNAHVVKNCTRITVGTSAQDSAVALVLARDDKNDLAVVRSSTPLSRVATFFAPVARSWELRAAMSIARLRRDQGKRVEARDLLAPVYGVFTEGFDTYDLREAKVLLHELAL